MLQVMVRAKCRERNPKQLTGYYHFSGEFKRGKSIAARRSQCEPSFFLFKFSPKVLEH